MTDGTPTYEPPGSSPPLPATLVVAMIVLGMLGSAVLGGDGSSRVGERWEPASEGLPTSGVFFGVTFGHVDGDGKLDVVATSDGDGIFVLLGDGTGSWTVTSAPPEDQGGFGGVCLGDYDGDGNADLFVGSPGAEELNPKGIHLYRGDGSGGFVDETSGSGLPTTSNWRGVAVGDLNKDGHLDLVATSGYGAANGIHAFVGDGEGNFDDQSLGLPSNQDRDSNVVLADFDDDGNMDIAAGGLPGASVYLGNGGAGGSMTWTSSSVGLPNARCSGISAADLNDDGLVDLVVSAVEAGPGGGVYAYENTRDAGLWREFPSSGLPDSGDYVENGVADFDGDGNLDIVTTGGFDTTYGIHVYLGNGEGSWQEGSVGLPEGEFYVGVDVGDFDADGSPDIVAGKRTGGGGVEVWRNMWGMDLPEVALMAPEDGSSLTGGSEQVIGWSVSGGAPPYSIALKYSTDGGASYPNAIADDVTQSLPGRTNASWSVPAIDSATVRVVVEVRDAQGLSSLVANLVDLEIDSTSPGVDATIPVNGSRGVDLDGDVSITFDEAMDHSSSAAVSISGPGSPALTGPSWTGTTLSLRPSGLALNTTYLVSVSTEARDDSEPGNHLGEEHSFAFTTRAGAVDSPPVARAGPDREVDQHAVVTFDGTGSTDDAGIVEWTWRLVYEDEAYELHGPSPTFTFDRVGSYEVSLTVRDADDHESTDHMFVTVRDVDPPVAVAGDDVAVEQHRKVALDGSSSYDNVGITYYEWTFEYDGALTSLSGPTHVFQFDNAGEYVVTLTVGDAAGNSAQATMNVTVRDTEPPVAVLGEDITVKEGKEVVLDGNSSTDNVGVVSWSWTIERRGKVTSLSGAVVTYRFTEPGRYLVNLTVEDASGLESSESLYVTVREKDDGPGFGLIIAVSTLAVVTMIELGRRRSRGMK